MDEDVGRDPRRIVDVPHTGVLQRLPLHRRYADRDVEYILRPLLHGDDHSRQLEANGRIRGLRCLSKGGSRGAKHGRQK